MSLGEKILKLRKQSGLSQEELGEKVNVTRQTISNWELNETSPNPEQLKILSKELNVSIDELLDNDVKDLLVEKVSNTEKLSKTVLTLLKIVICFIVFAIVIWIILFVGRIIVKNSEDKGNLIDETIICKLYGESHSFGIKYYELTGEPKELGGDSYFSDILDLGKYNDAYQIFNVINDYVKKNGGTCVRVGAHNLDEIITMYIKSETLTKTGATFIIEEDFDDYDITYGDPFKLEKYDYSTNSWRDVPIICDNCIFNLPGYSASPKKPLEIKQDWSKLYGELPKGFYRIVKDAYFNTSYDKFNANNVYKIWCEFSIDE